MSNKYKTPLLDRRGAEPDERSESDEVGWWNKIKEIHHPGLCLVTFGASPESTPPVQEGSLCWRKPVF
jgi:hypothetical protein